MKRHVLVVGNGRELPAYIHQVDPEARTSVLVRSDVLKRVRDASLHARIVGVSSTDDSSWITMARAIHEVEPVTHVASFSEKDQDKAAAVASALGLGMHSAETVRAVHDKLHMRDRLTAAGIPGPLAGQVASPDDITDFADRHGYPVVVKPVMGAASSGVTVVHRPSQAEAAWQWGLAAEDAADGRLMVETFLDGPEISVEAFSERGEHLIVAITLKVKDPVHCVELGHMIRGELPPETEHLVRETVTDVLRALDVQNGLTHTEIILTDEGPRLVETHLRPAGDLIPETIRDTHGFDLLDLFVRQSIGESVIDRLRLGHRDLESSDRYAAVWYRVPDRSGRVVAVEGLAEAGSIAGVLSVELELEVGSDVVEVPRDSRDRLLVVRAISHSPAHALKIARTAAETVTVTIDEASGSEATREVRASASVAEKVRQAYAALNPAGSGALAPVAAEALTEASVAGFALRAAETHRWDDGRILPAEVLERHLAELAFEALTAVALAAPGRIDVGASMDEVARAAGRDLDWFDAPEDPGRRDALRASLDIARLPESRADDLKATLARRVEQLRDALDDEWSPQPDVCLAALPLFSRPVADVLVFVALGCDTRCSDVVLRRFGHRYLGRQAPEGLTTRHLERSAEILAGVLDGQA
ncbi:ATP-grasp domain-containing protein [Streptosporangium amethystogenes subsp. fukuiense]|uniref:ATP-grasp domain-containing protein n=1 Tax=Streptosporangium amethystogenes subsp. fukuiense TaxID=698418 RepID=A0ABW2TAN8_9ACTN